MLQSDQGYYFGLGVFETIRVKEKKGLLLGQHLQRLNKGLDTLGIKTVMTDEQVEAYLDQQGVDVGVLKIAVSEKNIDFSTRISPYTSQHYQTGYQLMVSSILRNETSPLTYLKSLNFGDNILAKQHAQQHHYDDALFLNTKGCVTETTSSNIFFVNGDVIHTPSVKSGLLPGVMREVICQHEHVIEKEITMGEVSCYDACFLTNSIMGIMKVTAIGDVKFNKDDHVIRLQKTYQAFY
ncbi:MAG: aminotransferase class IV [Defluviitaleaceae bacterium]|nr:aminotransferase class IV [Defluviitaleaceae bacterium]